ncbi:MAG: hypothetical protein V1908_04550 [Candidatus Peregrinibacteria bacterium]
MKLTCFNIAFDSLAPQRQIYQHGGNEVAATGFGDARGGRERGMVSSLEAPADDAPAEPAPANDAKPNVPNATPAASTEKVEEEKKVERKKIKHAVDKNLEAGIAPFKSKIEAALSLDKLRGNLDALKPFAEFLKTHWTFDTKADKASDWNHRFCVSILNESNLTPKQERYAAYALQRFLDYNLFTTHGGRYDVREEDRSSNSNTRIDGWLGGYAINALSAYLYYDCQGNLSDGEWKTFWKKYEVAGWADLNDTPTRKQAFLDATNYLAGIYTGADQPEVAPKAVAGATKEPGANAPAGASVAEVGQLDSDALDVIQAHIDSQWRSRKKADQSNLEEIKGDLATMRRNGPDYLWYVNTILNPAITRPGSWPRQAFEIYKKAYEKNRLAQSRYISLKGNPIAIEEVNRARQESERSEKAEQDDYENLELAIAAYFNRKLELEKETSTIIFRDFQASAAGRDFPKNLDWKQIMDLKGREKIENDLLPTAIGPYAIFGSLENYFNPVPKRVFGSLDDLLNAVKPDQKVHLGDVLSSKHVGSNGLDPLTNINNAIYRNNLQILRDKFWNSHAMLARELAKAEKEMDRVPLYTAVALAKNKQWSIG